MYRLISPLVLCVITLIALTTSTCAATFIPSSDVRFLYEGRFDQSDPAGPVVVWQGSRIRIDFEGDSLALKFSDSTDQNFFDAEIDGRTTLVSIRSDGRVEGNAFSGLGPGRHKLQLFKRSEAAAGTVRFRGIEINNDAQAFAPQTPRYQLAMQFIGDSITAGACNEDGATDQWEDRSTHNNARSYGAFTAAAFSADYRNVSVSGMGIATGWTPIKAGQIWDRVYPDPASARADLTKWTPQVVFVNLGENDDSFTKSKAMPFPADDYTNGYVALVKSIRQAYPAAHIVILRGGMFGGSQS
ncbi:MAG TPA: GDSL-type esterase/lipase family protein [Opitutus sp.]|nr:GDSL-type esterase/lipase family protein [Opitutus sp.]